ncbi:MAG: DUF2169 domain-containing protein [Myxococcales bacterium]|nr:DUF2169 domain-containing protein [Myxococcales bacterium]MCB9526765.1 DUF2169 domain-containing protein [Myxococcales bacterium]
MAEQAAPTTERPRDRIEHDGWLAMFVPDSTLEGLQAFHFIVKRTYTFAPDEIAEPTTWQQAIHLSDQHFEGAGPYEAALRYENELLPPKPGTDVFVTATCYPPGGEARFCYPEVRVADAHRSRLAVFGDRTAVIKAGQTPLFSAAEKFSALPVRYEFAYGGVDRQHSLAPILCPTNPVGTGYLVQPIDGAPARDQWAVLPNIEWPDRLLTPETLFVGTKDRKTELRPPAGFGPIPRYWEPRASRAGMPADAKPFWKLLYEDKPSVNDEHFLEMQPEFWRSANGGLVLPVHLEGHEKLVLTHLHREREELVIRLPIKNPTLRTAINDEAMQPVPLKLDTVHVEVELGELALVWRGSVPKPASLETLAELERVLMEIDGELILPAPLLGTGFPLELLTGDFPGQAILDALPKPPKKG